MQKKHPPTQHNKNRRRGPRRKPPRPKSDEASESSQTHNPRGKGQKPTRSNKGRQYQGQGQSNSSRFSKPVGTQALFRKLDHLTELHQNARKKYFEQYLRADKQGRKKLETNYNSTLSQLRNLEKSLTPSQRISLEKRFHPYKPDLDFSNKHNLDPRGENVPFNKKFEDIHTTSSQSEQNYSEDNEESVGTIQDYNNYKAGHKA